MVDADGFRPNVGIVIANSGYVENSGQDGGHSDGAGRDRGEHCGQVLWARRVGGHDAWQFPQGGINEDESPEDAMYRELHEEVGLRRDDVAILGRTKGWLRYRLPRRMRRNNSSPGFVGQKQKWFMLQLQTADEKVCLDLSDKAEFDHWRWVSFWYPLNQVIEFKRDVYRRALHELAPHLPVD